MPMIAKYCEIYIVRESDFGEFLHKYLEQKAETFTEF